VTVGFFSFFFCNGHFLPRLDFLFKIPPSNAIIFLREKVAQEETQASRKSVPAFIFYYFFFFFFKLVG